MDRNHSRNSLERMFLCLLCAFLMPLAAFAQGGESTVDALVKLGFENVAWAEDDSERVFLLENNAYRLTGVGIGKALDEIQKSGMPEDGRICRLIVLDNNVPKISLCCNKKEVGERDILRSDWNVSYDLGDGWELVKGKERKNSSLHKVDLVLYPMFSFKNGRLSVPYQVRLNLNPTLEASLWRGGKVTAQLVIPIVNDYGYKYDDVRPGFLTVSQTVRLPYDIFLTGTVGFFNNNRNGVDLAAAYYPKKGDFWFDARASYTIFGEWGEWHGGKNTHPFKLGYDKNSGKVTGHIAANYYYKDWDTQFSLRGEKYLQGECGVRFDMIRHMKYCSIGFYGMYVPDDWHNDGINGGFRFVINLPPYKYKKKGYIPRVTTSRIWGFEYNAGGTFVYGQSFKANCQSNMSEDIKYNPAYLKQELLNF